MGKKKTVQTHTREDKHGQEKGNLKEKLNLFNSNRKLCYKDKFVLANGPGDRVSIPGRIIPKTQKMVLDAALLNTQHYKVRIKGRAIHGKE